MALTVLTWTAARLHVRAEPAAVLYLALVVVVALRGRAVPAFLTALAVTVLWDAVFTAPTVTPGARLFRDVVTIVAYSATAVVISRLVATRRTRERYWWNVFDNSPTMYLVVDGDGTVRAANAFGAARLGYDAAELIGRPVFELCAAEDRDELRAFLGRCLAQLGVSLVWEGWKVHRDGTRLRMRETGRAIQPGDDPPVVLLACEDVTQREQAEAERHTHLRFLETMDRVNRVIQGAADLEQMMRDVLDVALEVLDADQTGLVYPCDPDAPAWTITMSRARPGAEDSLAARPELPRTPDQADLVQTVLATDGPVQLGPGVGRPVPDQARARGAQSMLAMAVYPKEDRPYMFGASQVSHPRVWTPEEVRLFQEMGRRLADALTSLTIRRDAQAREARFRALVEHGLDLIAILDEHGIHRYASPSYEAILGYTPQEMLGTNAFDFVHPEDAPVLGGVLSPEALAGGPKHVPPVRIRHRDGSWRTITGVVTDMRGDPAVGGIVANGRDVTNALQLEEQLRQAQKMEAIGRLAGGVAHDFNNLLTVIAGYSDFIRAASPPGDERREDATEIRRAADRAALLTQQLLAFSRKQTLRPEVLAVNAAVEGASRMLGRLIGEDVAIELRLAPDAGAVRVDAGQLQQVLLNLAVNARDAMPLGGRLTIATAGVTLEHETPAQPGPLARGRYVRLTVSDTGAGMTPEVLAHAFEPFFTTKEPGKGTGLGLSTVYGIVTQSQGRLRVDSAPGRGTTVEVYFPTASGPSADAAPAAGAADAGGAETVLLVEDDPMVRRLAEQTLARAGYRVLAAVGADDALRLVAGDDTPIDLVVTDVVMPGLSGPELVRRLEGVRPEIRVLYVSGYADDAMERHGVNEERVSFLAKPFNSETLLRRVREVLDVDG